MRRTCWRRSGWAALAGLLAASGWGSPLLGQHVRLTGTTTVRYIELAPMERDSVPVEQTVGDGVRRVTVDDRVVSCFSGEAFCSYFRTGSAVHTSPAHQDLAVSAWGFGQGLRAFARLRGRTVLSGQDDLWPRADDAFDALEAYLEYHGPWLRLRAGRQFETSGLGYYNFDGVATQVRPTRPVSLTGFAGRSLIRGLNEAHSSSALRAVEGLAPDEPAWLLGGRITVGPLRGASASLVYQREIRDDRLALYSERAAVDVVGRLYGWTLDASLETDLAASDLNEARARLSWRPGTAWSVATQLQFYRPFFETWTIWGAFAPVGFTEAQVSAGWRPARRPWSLEGAAAFRSYDETGASASFGETRTDGWRVTGAASLGLAEQWRAQAGARLDIGFGAARAAADARLERRFGPATVVGVNVTAFERAYEFRVDEGLVLGAVHGGLGPVPLILRTSKRRTPQPE